MINKLKNKIFKLNYLFLLITKIIYLLFAVLVFSNLTSLGDTDRYLNGELDFNLTIISSGTFFIIFIISLIKKILYFEILTHLFICLTTFYSLINLINHLNLNKRLENTLIFLLLMPSFGMWTSIVSKEAINLFFTSFILIWVINLINNKPSKNLLFYICCLYFSILIRPSVGIPLFIFILYLYVMNIINEYKYFKLLILITSLLILILTLIIILPYINDVYLPLAQGYFNPLYYDARSTRDLTFWVSYYDFFKKAPYGILIANIGPTFTESLKQPFFIPYFFEGLIFIFVIIFYVIIFYLDIFKKKYFNFKHIFFILFILTFILIINYPFGIFNPGTAIRYRSSYYHIILILLFYFYNNQKNIKKTL